MRSFLVLLFSLNCVLLILAVLIQQGKGASMGLLSGAGQTWFGPAGSKTLLMKITVGLAGAFLFLAILLALASAPRQLAPPMQQPAPAAAPPQGSQAPAPHP
jgi:preprotein translocase subunit SecG